MCRSFNDISDIDCHYSGNENIKMFCVWLITSSYGQNYVFIIWIWKINSNNVKKISIFWTYETFCYSIYFTRYMFKYLDMYIHVICHLMPQCKSSLLGWNIHICHLLFSAHWCYQHIEKNMKLTMKFFLHFNGVQ